MVVSDLKRQLIIKGVTKAGDVFRPSDWAERLCGTMSLFGPEQKLKYSPLVRPTTIDGIRSVVVDYELADLEPRIFKFLLTFAQDNDLELVEQVGSIGVGSSVGADVLERRLEKELRDG